MKSARAALLASTMLWPAQAHAGPLFAVVGGLVSGFGFAGVGGVIAGLGGIGYVGGAGFISAFAAGYGVAAFLGSGLGSLLLSVGLSAAQYLRNQQRAPKMDSARINTRVAEGERWVIGARARSGGQDAFGEYDADGNFWYIVIHSDTEAALATGGRPYQIYFDDVVIEVGEDNQVTTAEFTKQQKEGGDPVFSIWTTTYSALDPTPPAIADFKAAFPAWTDDHKLVGTTYSVVKCKVLKQEDRYKVMRWRGPIGLGEPAVSIVDDFGLMFDPRDGSQSIVDRSTWKPSSNLAIVWAWWRTHRLGRAKPMASVAWDQIAAQADICDQTVLDKNGNEHKRYECGIAVPDSKPRGDAEQEILLCGDGVILYDSTGKAYIKVGAWEEPALTLSRNRDILAMASRTAQDGEMQSDGVIVRYIEPEFGWIAQPCAPWKNPLYFEEGRLPRYLSVDILGCHDHNQAVRLAKAIGQTSQAPYRLAPTVGLRGLKAKRERLVDLAYDDIWQGPHKIATTVEEDEVGLTVSFGIVPVSANHWTLLEGEEGDKPAPVVAIEYDKTLPLATGVTVTAAPVPGSGGNAVRLEAVFDAATRIDWRYEFQFRKVGELAWKPMLVLMDDLVAYSDTVDDGSDYEVQWRTVTTSGRASDWKDPAATVSAVADLIAPVVLSSFGVTGGLGNATLAFATAADAHLKKIGIYRVPAGGTLNTTTHLVATLAAGPGTSSGYVDGDLTPTERIVNGDFASLAGWTFEADWSGGSGAAVKVAGAANRNFSRAITLASGKVYRIGFDVTAWAAGNILPRFQGGTTANGTQLNFGAGTGTKFQKITAATGNTTFQMTGFATTAITIDNISCIEETAACAPQGRWDYYAIPMNGSSVAGPTSGPVTVNVY